ncbi:F-box protein 11 [Streptomyces sp. SLBN-118]|uniref:right-handed parallel beta-helix repeat-containing protein n=1 Tax=Streptomyces sp. SLBN-118 TaxID=2768454 RepID=UPI0011681BDF|nr:right-handed parallel beta-helix repeat-containing protein [Streptomyces sp. SLBN-118]TQK51584.1 F-box protein 11 [Streptomyces sp. SLBN-118]
MPGTPAAFMSYVRFNDEHDDGLLTQLRERLGTEVRAQTGEEFAIFQDRNDVAWGQNWQQRIDEALDAVTLLLVIITPSLFRSPACRAEVARFLEREGELGRQGLILPVYYISARELDDPELREADEMARVLASRQHADWRELRFEPFTSPLVRKAIAQLASRMRDTFWHPPAPTRARPVRTAEAGGAAAGSTEQTGDTARVVAKSEPPTHVVDPYHRGDFATVGAAIKAAQPGDRILVRPGLYEEGLVVDKPLEILGDGPLADIQIRAHDSYVLAFRAGIGRVANLTLRQTGGAWHGVDITQGRLELEGCDISSQGLAGVAIGNGADPRLRRNQIHGNKQSGVFVRDGGGGTLEDNDITGNTYAGVEIKTGGNPTLRANQIRDNGGGGVYVHDSGMGTLEDNDITGNALAGVTIRTGGSPTLRRNQIRDNRQSGVFVQDSGVGTLEANDITGSALAGVTIKAGGSPTLRGNQIHDNKGGGVFVYDSGVGTLEDNDITGNALAGVEIQAGCSPTLRRNQIRDNRQSGVFVQDSGVGTLEDNDITGNAYAGVEIKTGGNPTLRGNQIRDNKGGGVFVYDSGVGTLEANDITGNTYAGVTIRTGGSPTLRRNQIHDNKQNGVFVQDSGGGTLEDNDITGNAYAGVETKTGAEPTLRRNRIHRNKNAAVRIHEGGGGVFEDNDLTANSRGAWDIAKECQENVVRARNKE